MVGAGLAGLAAARILTDAGWDVTVVEARERVGGRIWTVRLDNDEIAEMGAEWVMPGDAELRSWADRFGVAMVEAGIDYLRREPRGPGASSQGEQDAFLADFPEAAGRLSACDATPAMRRAVAGEIAGAMSQVS